MQISDSKFLNGLSAVVSYNEHLKVQEERRIEENKNRRLQADNIQLLAAKRKAEDMLDVLEETKRQLLEANRKLKNANNRHAVTK